MLKTFTLKFMILCLFLFDVFNYSWIQIFGRVVFWQESGGTICIIIYMSDIHRDDTTTFIMFKV